MAINWGSLVGIALWALIPGFIAQKKERSFFGYFALSFVITPLITTNVTHCLKNLNEQPASDSSSMQTKAADSQEEKWVCKCGCENVNSLAYCPMCKRSREDGEK